MELKESFAEVGMCIKPFILRRWCQWKLSRTKRGFRV